MWHDLALDVAGLDVKRDSVSLIIIAKARMVEGVGLARYVERDGLTGLRDGGLVEDGEGVWERGGNARDFNVAGRALDPAEAAVGFALGRGGENG